MDAASCSWDTPRVPESFTRPRPTASETLTKLAKLVARTEHKQESRGPKPLPRRASPSPSPCVCSECGQSFSDMDSLLHHQQREHTLPKPHQCLSCGKEFSLLSSLQLHKCIHDPAPCQLCLGKPFLGGALCSRCTAGTSDPQSPQGKSPHRHDSSPYACAPCGKAFSQKQALLYHQQAGCSSKPASLTVKADSKISSPPVSTDSPPPETEPASPASDTSSAPETPVEHSQCLHCRRGFRSNAGLVSHQRSSHPMEWQRSKVKKKTKKKQKLLSCRSCEMVFTNTAKLYLHRKERHSREKDIRRDPRPQRLQIKRRKGETYPCQVCGRVFLHHLSLMAHSKQHTTTTTQSQGSQGQPARKAAAAASKEPKTKKPKSSLTDQIGRTIVRASSKRPRKELSRPEEEETGEFPCPSCAEVFSLQSALRRHQELHQPSVSRRRCSVCCQGMGSSKGPRAKRKRLYHCIPCQQAFTMLDTFLQHCQDHLLLREGDGGVGREGLSDTEGKA